MGKHLQKSSYVSQNVNWESQRIYMFNEKKKVLTFSIYILGDLKGPFIVFLFAPSFLAP